MEQGEIRLVLTTALGPDHPINRHCYVHGDGVAVIALEVPDATAAYRESTKRGATGAIAPTPLKMSRASSVIRLFTAMVTPSSSSLIAQIT